MKQKTPPLFPRPILFCTHSLGIAALIAAQPLKACADEEVLDLGHNFDLTQVTETDATVRHAETGLRVDTGHHQPWPGITRPAPKGSWDLSAYASLAVRVRN